jgi:hypothetical protein
MESRFLPLSLLDTGFSLFSVDFDLVQTSSSTVKRILTFCMGCCSLGGAVAVHCAAKRKISTLAGLIVLDVVEVIMNFLSLSEI